MKLLFLTIPLIILFILLFGCGIEDRNREQCVTLGESCHPEVTPTAEPKIIKGPAGPQGEPGQQGVPGKPGESCTIEQAVNGALITCQNNTILILNGTDAPPTPYTVTSMVDPCGPQGGYDEVLLRLANNTLIAHYASGANQFLTVIGPGNYQTTDGTSCYFTVNPDLSISGEHN